MSVFAQLSDGSHFVSGFANHKSGKSVGLVVPLFADGGSLQHAVVRALLHLGANVNFGGVLHGAVGAKLGAGLGNVDLAINDLAVSAHSNNSNGAVGLHGALSVFAGFALNGAAGNDAHAGLQAAGNGRLGSGLRGRLGSGLAGRSRAGGGAASYEAQSQSENQN